MMTKSPIYEHTFLSVCPKGITRHFVLSVFRFMNLEMNCEFDNESVHKNEVYGVSTAMQYSSLVW